MKTFLAVFHIKKIGTPTEIRKIEATSKTGAVKIAKALARFEDKRLFDLREIVFCSHPKTSIDQDADGMPSVCDLCGEVVK